MKFDIAEGDYKKLGVTPADGGVTFTFAAEWGADCAILLYNRADFLEHKNGRKVTRRIEVPRAYGRGAVRSVTVLGLSADDLAYNYEINGAVCQDAYATRIYGRDVWRDTDRAAWDYQVCCGYEDPAFDWQGDKNPKVPRREMVMYKLHVRGFSMDAGIRGHKKGTFAAVEERIPYLKELGVTTVEFMPVYEFEEWMLQNPASLPDYIQWKSEKSDLIKPEVKTTCDKVNYWGYTGGNYFAVKASYAGTRCPSVEWKKVVRALHAAGMECVMEVYVPEDVNRNMILDALRYWVREYHVDGFHLLGATQIASMAAEDVWLASCKIFYTSFEPRFTAGETAYPHLFVYSDEYLYPVRKMLNHCNGSIMDFICQQRKQNQTVGFVNYIADNNGFSLLDLFSYGEKHNADNGEDNCDGSNWNYSNNYGAEGKTAKRYVKAVRERQLSNAFAILMCGQGVPLICAGDEMGNSQKGNNNAYCQDNVIGWVNWKAGAKYAWLTSFVQRLAAFRREHPALASEEPKQLSDYKRKGYPDLSYHGESAWVSELPGEAQAVGMMYCGAYAKRADGTEDDFIYIGYNFHLGAGRLALPKLPEGKKWYLVMDTAAGTEPFLEEELLQKEAQIAINGQSVMILIGK